MRRMLRTVRDANLSWMLGSVCRQLRVRMASMGMALGVRLW